MFRIDVTLWYTGSESGTGDMVSPKHEAQEQNRTIVGRKPVAYTGAHGNLLPWVLGMPALPGHRAMALPGLPEVGRTSQGPRYQNRKRAGHRPDVRQCMYANKTMDKSTGELVFKQGHAQPVL